MISYRANEAVTDSLNIIRCRSAFPSGYNLGERQFVTQQVIKFLVFPFVQINSKIFFGNTSPR